MELITILNRCHRFRGFVYHQAHFSADKKSIEVAVRPRNGFGRTAQKAPQIRCLFKLRGERRHQVALRFGGQGRHQAIFGTIRQNRV